MSRTLVRAVGVLATAALLGVGAVVASMVMGSIGGDEDEGATVQAAAPTPSAEPEPKSKRKARPSTRRRRPLTAGQRAARLAAAGIVRRQGYEPLRLADWRPRQTLRVLIGRQSGGKARRAFFFVGDRFVGTDAAEPSARLRIDDQRSRRITLVYDRYEPGDRACCPTGGIQRARFEWDGTALRPLDAIPPLAARSAPAA